MSRLLRTAQINRTNDAHRGRAGDNRSNADDGFTLIELVVGMLLLAVVLGSLAPVYYGLLSATRSSSTKSIATNLASSASEAVRAIPYTQVGYVSTPAACTGANPVMLSSGSVAPMASMPTSRTLFGTSYTITDCAYWADSTISGDTQAYKQSVVTICWNLKGGMTSDCSSNPGTCPRVANDTSSCVTQTSVVYPGGAGTYGGPASGSAVATTTTTPSMPPASPTALTAIDDPSAPSNTIDLSWTPPSSAPAPDHYVVYFTTTNPTPCTTSGGYTYCADISTMGAGNWSQAPAVTGSATNITVGAGTTYYFEVVSMTSGQRSNSTSNTASAASAPTGTTTTTTIPGTTTTTIPGAPTTTTSTSTTSTTVATCSMNSLIVTPTTGSGGGGVALDGSGHLVNYSAFGLSINASSTCANVYVAYAPSGCVPGASGCTTYYAPMSGSTGTLTGSAGTASTTWSVGNQYFTLVQGASYTPWNPITQQQVITCTQKGSSGKC